MTIKEFYTKKYTDDALGKSISPSVGFKDLYKALKDKKDIYSLIGVGDSLIRERIFEELARIEGVSYGDIYDLWMGAEA